MYLNCKSWFSFRFGTFKTEELVETAGQLGVKTMALTNINNTCDVWNFVDHCRERGIKPVAGTEIRNGDAFLYLLLARNNDGLFEINKFLSEHRHHDVAFPNKFPHSRNVFVVYPFALYSPDELNDNEFIGVQATEVNKLYNLNCSAYPSKFVIRHPVTFRNDKMYNAHRLLRAIDKNIVITKQQPEHIAGKHESFIAPHVLSEKFSQYPSIITATQDLLNNCVIEMEFGSDKTKKQYSLSKEDDRLLLQKLALEGMRKRYGERNKAAEERVKKELQIINDQDFNAYFLITSDVIKYARSRQFFYVGRGSGANSIVAYCLNITDVDPLELDLYFERFLNPKRSVPPDFDIDFSWKDRDEIIAYIFKRYGGEHACLLGSYTTFQSRALKRELGKVFGLPKEEIDGLERGNMKEDRIRRTIEKYSNIIRNFPNHMSIHAGGLMISEKPLYHYTALELPSKGFSSSQIDMHIAEKIGLYKLDILSQRGLGHIRETIEIVQQNRNETIDITQVEKFKKNKKIADKIRAADTIGCFYIESPAMRQLLQKLKCDDYLTLVAASSIIRPGVAQSGMMKQYIYRYHHPGDFTYLHPKMEELLKETYGIMVYQEDVIKVAHYFASLDLAEADVLRRAMSGKYRGQKEFEKIRNNFFNNCREKGYDDAVTAEVWRQIESFGGYSFSKAHSASFAVESYQSLFLKTYYPIEFMVAVINNFGGFYNRELYFHELKKTGARIHPPCVNKSKYLTSLDGIDVSMGLIHIEGLDKNFAEQIISNRIVDGEYRSLHDFIERLSPQIAQLNILIKIDAFRFTGRNKKELMWDANFLQKHHKNPAGRQLFKAEPVKFALPHLAQHPLDEAIDQIEILGFPLCNAFELADDDVTQYIAAKDIGAHLGKEIKMLGYLITTKEVRTTKNDIMVFGTFLDVNGDWLDTLHFPDVLKKYPVNGKGFYRLHGTVSEDFGVFTLEIKFCQKVGIKDRSANANALMSRNLHDAVGQ
ncbi:MAG: DNA polymerase III subunit alpha [Chitinophagaceae bacterium]|nr:DNA polymerase III subunit alpha [Chitinophagaceae bacterium]